MALPSAPPVTPHPTGDPSAGLIGGTYAVDTTRLLPGAAGGLSAFVAIDRRGADIPLMAVQVRPHAPARAAALQMLLANPVDGILGPIAHGPARGPGGEMAWFVICPAPSGPPVWSVPQGNGAATAARPWTEPELLECLLRPAAHALERLHARALTHRAIRLDNLFRAGPREAVILGHAWAAPPASLQPALYEPPYSAMCLPAGRGDGSIADDVYALGVVLLTLALGRAPLAGLDDAAIIRRKLELGSFTALAGDERLPPMIADLVRGMLAEDPEHRPPPALLADPVAARARRVAAHPPRRGQRPLEIGQQTAWNARTLAYSLASDPEQGARQLRGGAVDAWLRRGLGEPMLAARLEDTLHVRGADAAPEDQRIDSMLVMRAVAVLDPLAPLCWRNVALWPNGLGPALAELTAAAPPTTTGPDRAEVLQQIIATDALGAWASVRSDRCDPTALRAEASQYRNFLRMGGWSGGLARLRYVLNPLMPCRSRLLQGRCVVRLADLLPALEAAAGVPELRKETPIDYEIAAFLAARNEHHIEGELAALSDTGHPERAALTQLRLLAMLQLRLHGRKLPALSAWLAEQARPALATWRNRQRRERIEQALNELTGAGQLTALLGVLEDPQALAVDAREFQEAALAVQAIDTELAAHRRRRPPRAPKPPAASPTTPRSGLARRRWRSPPSPRCCRDGQDLARRLAAGLAALVAGPGLRCGRHAGHAHLHSRGPLARAGADFGGRGSVARQIHRTLGGAVRSCRHGAAAG